MTTKSIDYEKLTKTKVTLPAITLLGFVLIGINLNGWSVDYFGEWFITKAEASEQFEQISKQVADNQALIVSHVGEYKLNENAKGMARIQDALFELEFHVAENGETDLTRDRKRSLDTQLARLGRMRACIVRNQHLSDDEVAENCDAIQ